MVRKQGQIAGAHGKIGKIEKIDGPGRSLEGRRTGNEPPPYLDRVAAGAFEASPDGQITDANRRLARLLGSDSREELLGRSLVDLLVDPSALVPALGHLGEGQELATDEVRLRTQEGDEVVALLSAKLVVEPGKGDRRVVGTLIDITERKRRESDLERLAFEDPLTGLANRRALDEHATKYLALADRRGTFMGVAYLDLTHFKAINDRFGHSSGDAVLVEASRRLEAAARDSDVVSRVGGDEFVALLPDVEDLDAVVTAVRRMISELEATPVGLDDTKVTIRAEAGISVYPEDGTCLADLLRAADRAMYRAKENRGNAELDEEDGGEDDPAVLPAARGRAVSRPARH